jgi:hypothetical protein
MIKANDVARARGPPGKLAFDVENTTAAAGVREVLLLF